MSEESEPPQNPPHLPTNPQPLPNQVQGNLGIPPHVLAQMLAAQGQGPFPAGGIQLTLPGIIQQQQHWQGPYPPPDAVERYEVVLPGTFDRLIGMAERLQAAQITQSQDAIDNTRDDTRRGHWLGFVTTAAAMLGAVATVSSNPWVAGLFLSVPVMAVAKALIETSKAPTQTDIIKAASELQHQASPPPAPPAG